MKKIIIIFKLILRSKFILKKPKKHDLILFDDTSVKHLEICLSNFHYFVLQSRIDTINEVYISFELLKNMKKNFSKGNLFTVYLISLIQVIKPKAVVTIIDNSLKFSIIAKILEKEITFIAIQNGSRVDLLEWDYVYKAKKIKFNYLNNFYIPHFFCYGDYEKDLYKKLNIKINNFYPVGSVRWTNFLHHIKNENKTLDKYNCDIVQ